MSRTIRLGFFIISALLVLATGVFLIGDRRFAFSRTYTLTTRVPSVEGLLKGAEVRVGGISRGTVTAIDLPAEPGGKMIVRMKLAEATHELIRDDSVASIANDGMWGDKHIDVSFGSPAAARLDDGSAIKAEDAPGMPDMATLTRRAGVAMDDVQAAAAGFRDNMDALKRNFLFRGFYKDRGYEDSATLTAHDVGRLPRGPAAETFSFEAQKLFGDEDGARLKETKPLAVAGKALETREFGLAVVVARHGMTGDTEEIKVLTQARAANVRDYLVQNFNMDDTKLKTLGAGKDAKVTPAGGLVEIVIYPRGAK